MVAPKSCYQKCDVSGCYQECVHVEVITDNGTEKPKEAVPMAPPVVGAAQDTAPTPTGLVGVKAAADRPAPEKVARIAGGGGGDKTQDGRGGVPEDTCSPGQSSKTGKKPCTACPAGTFAGAPGALRCERCPQGSFSNSTGASECIKCGGNGSTVRLGATTGAECGAHAHVTGVQLISYEHRHDDRVVVEGSSGDDSWRPLPYGGASGPWYGGWWIAVHGRNLGKGQKDVEDVTVGDVKCKKSVWLSESKIACMTPRGMGQAISVTVGLKSGAASVHGKFSYNAPRVDSYHPRGGAPRGGFWVTVTGKNFGHVDTRPTVYLAGRICFESYWVSDTKVLCRAPPGVGGQAMLHTIDVQFEPVDHIQEMPRRLRQWAKGVVGTKAKSVPQYKPDSNQYVKTVLIDTKAAKTAAQGSALVVKDGSAALEERKKDWAKKEEAVKQELTFVKESKGDAEVASVSAYLQGAEERVAEAERKEDEARAQRLKELKEREAEEERRRREDEAAFEADRQREEEAKKGTERAKDKLQKFNAAKKAKEQARHSVEAAALLKAMEPCLSMVTLDCGRDGTCTYATEDALVSPLCGDASLNKTGASVGAAGMEGTDGGKKVLALLWERRRAHEEAHNLTASAEAMLDAKAGTAKLDAAAKAVSQAEEKLKLAGLEAGRGLIAAKAKVTGLLEERRKAKEEAEREEAREKVEHRRKGDEAVKVADAQLKKGASASARASHGSAAVEYELASAKEEMAGVLQDLMQRVEAGEKEEEERVRLAAERARADEEERAAKEVTRLKEEEETKTRQAAELREREEKEGADRVETAIAEELLVQKFEQALQAALALADRLAEDGEGAAFDAEVDAVDQAIAETQEAFKKQVKPLVHRLEKLHMAMTKVP